MKQVLHIFRKDTRRFWPEVVASLAATVALVCVVPLRWTTLPLRVAAEGGRPNLATIDTLLVGLVIASWALLISRSVHAESLVGDRQFWVTRPYEWKRLLAAKLLFLAVYLYLPLVLAQWVLLYAAGLSSFATLSGLLFNLLLITGLVVLPLAAIAAVTDNFFRMAFTLLVVLVAGIGAVLGMSLHRFGNLPNHVESNLYFLATDDLASPAHALLPLGHHAQLVFALLLAAVCGGVVAMQYARRRTWICRAVLLALPVALGLGAAWQAHFALHGEALLDRSYPAVAGVVPIQFSFAPDATHQLTVFRGKNRDGELIAGVGVPLGASEIADGTALLIDSQTLTMEAADGFRWSAEENELNMDHHVLPGRGAREGVNLPREYFEMPYTIYQRFKGGPVTLRMTMQVSELQATHSVQVAMPEREVVVPGFGVCTVRTEGYGVFQCRSALREPQLTHVDVEWSDGPCVAPQTEVQMVRGNAWPGLLDREPAEFGIVPIEIAQVESSWPLAMGVDPWRRTVCTGTPLTFTQYKLTGRRQIQLTIPNLYFPPENPASNIDHSDGRAPVKASS